jgi:hypothetical protein
MRRRFLKSLPLIPLGLKQVMAAGSMLGSTARSSKVASVDGVPMLVVDGHPLRSATFETYVPQLRHFQQFAEAGTDIFGFSTNAAACDYGHSRTTWVDPNTWDHSQFEERAAMILEARPDALLLPRVNLGTPGWWLKEHEDELERFDDGSTVPTGHNPTLPRDRAFPSLASRKWREDIGKAIERLIQHVRDSRFGPHVIGWVLSGGHTEEWYHWSCNTARPAGYSSSTQAAFRRWLTDKYRVDRSLQIAWSDSHVTLSTAPVPTAAERSRVGDDHFRDSATQMNVIDFYLFWNDLLPDTIDHFAGVAKRASAGWQVVGAFYGYLYEFAGDPEFGHNAVSRLVRSPHIDFMAVTASYFHRQSGAGCDYQRSPAASLPLHGKLWYHDNDVVSYRARQLMTERGFTDDEDWTRNRALQLKFLGYTETPQETHWMYRRGWGFAVCQGMHQAWFDLHGGYFDAVDLMNEIKRLNSLAADSRLGPRHSIAEILIVADERSCAYANPRSQLLKRALNDPQNQLTRIGAPCDHVLLDDLYLVDANRYRLVLFLNVYHIDARQQDAISRFQRDDKHLVWLGAPGLFNGPTRSLERMAELTGFAFVSASDGLPRRRSVTLDTSAADGFVVAENEQLFRKQFDGWTSYYAADVTNVMLAMRCVARRANLNFFVDTDDALFANASLVVLHAKTSGVRRVRFAAKTNVTDLVNGTDWHATQEVVLRAKEGETFLLQYVRTL